MEYAEEVYYNDQKYSSLYDDDTYYYSENYDDENDVLQREVKKIPLCESTNEIGLSVQKEDLKVKKDYFAEIEAEYVGVEEPLLTLEEFKSLRAKFVIPDSRKCYERVNPDIYSDSTDDEADVSPKNSAKATAFFTRYRKRYLIGIILSFLDSSLEYCFISKLIYNELLGIFKKSLENKISKQLKEIDSKYLRYQSTYRSQSDDILRQININGVITHLKSKFKGLDYLLSVKRFVYYLGDKYPQLFFPNTGSSTEFEKNSLGHRNNVYHYVGQKMLTGIEVKFLDMFLNVKKVSAFMFVKLTSEAFRPFKSMVKSLTLLSITDQFISIPGFTILQESFVENGQNLRFLELSKIKSDENGFQIGGLQYLKNLSTLFLEQNELTEIQVDDILRQIYSLKSLSCLSLSKNKVDTITPYFSFFIKNCNLKTLYFTKNLLKDSGSNNIEEFFLLSKSLAKNRTITHLRVNQASYRFRYQDRLRNFFDKISFFDDAGSKFYIRNLSMIFDSEEKEENIISE